MKLIVNKNCLLRYIIASCSEMKYRKPEISQSQSQSQVFILTKVITSMYKGDYNFIKRNAKPICGI